MVENESKYTDEDIENMNVDEDSLSMPGVRLPLALKLVMHMLQSKVLRH